MPPVTFAAIGLFALTSTLSYAASFNCQDASGAEESIICSDEVLSNLDGKMGSAFASARAGLADKSELLHQQRDWIKNRASECGPFESFTATERQLLCLRALTEVRTNELLQRAGLPPIGDDQLADYESAVESDHAGTSEAEALPKDIQEPVTSQISRVEDSSDRKSNDPLVGAQAKEAYQDYLLVKECGKIPGVAVNLDKIRAELKTMDERLTAAGYDPARLWNEATTEQVSGEMATALLAFGMVRLTAEIPEEDQGKAQEFCTSWERATLLEAASVAANPASTMDGQPLKDF